jgi:hypothetical protein
LAGFEVTLYGRFWVIPEATTLFTGRKLQESTDTEKGNRAGTRNSIVKKNEGVP